MGSCWRDYAAVKFTCKWAFFGAGCELGRGSLRVSVAMGRCSLYFTSLLLLFFLNCHSIVPFFTPFSTFLSLLPFLSIPTYLFFCVILLFIITFSCPSIVSFFTFLSLLSLPPIPTYLFFVLSFFSFYIISFLVLRYFPFHSPFFTLPSPDSNLPPLHSIFHKSSFLIPINFPPPIYITILKGI